MHSPFFIFKRDDMEAKELMIGDWVSVKGKPVKVTAFMSQYEQTKNAYEAGFARVDKLVVQNKVGMYSTISLDEVEPLPLNSEIITCNQWKADASKMAKGHYYKDIKFPHLPTLWESDKGYYMFLGGREVDVNYVHELQHILKVHKAEKEIRPWKK